jgi:putative spermidine/putrescine transport system permease protein
MAAVNPAIGAEFLVDDLMNEPPGPGRRRGRRLSPWRTVVLTLAGLYFIAPFYAGMRFALEGVDGRFSFSAITALPHAPGFAPAFWLSMRLAGATLLLLAVLVVPTVIYVHLRLPALRRLFEFLTILPIVIPPIVLILGVLEASPVWVKSSPYLLSFEYVILALPFAYRSLDAGLSAIDLKTLVEASRSLGANWLKTLWRVILPNLRPALLSAMVLTLALVLGEYTMASLDLWTTVPVWIVQFDAAANGHIQIAAAMLGLVVTWFLLTMIVLIDRSGARRRRAEGGA